MQEEEITQIEASSNVWGDEPPSRGKSAPFAWGEEPPPRSAATASREPTPTPQTWGEEPPTRDSLIGMKLGEYELRQRIGVGGMGFVYDGIQPLIGKRVAVKVLRPELAQAPEQVARLLAEARAVNAIRHRGIIDIFGFGQVPDGRQYIVMEFLDGQPLDAYLAEKNRLPPTEALSILDEVLAALGAAHGAGVVHRDLKPSNIFLVREPGGSRYVKLLDFGLAKQGQGPTGRTAQTRTDMVVGTPEYMAPEQARGQAVGPMTDLYAMGVVTFEMVTGRLPFNGTSPVDLLMKHVDARPPRPSEFVAELPPALDAFILQMLTKDPEARPGSADALRQQLHRLRRTLLRPTRAHAAANGVAPARTITPPPVVQAAPAPAAAAPTPPAPAVPAPAPAAVSEPTTTPHEVVKTDDAASRRSTTQVPVAGEPTAAELQAAGVRPARKRLVPVAIGAAALLAAGGLLLLRGGTPPPPTPEPTPQPVVATPPVVTPPPPVAPPAPNPTGATPPPGTPTETPGAVAATPGTTPTPTPAPETPVQVETVKPAPEPVKPPPSTKPRSLSQAQLALLDAIDRLELDMESREAAGKPIPNSVSARNMLKKMRSQARDAFDAKARSEVASQIDFWEKNYLKRP